MKSFHTVHLEDQKTGRARCGDFGTEFSELTKEVNCRQCLEVRIREIDEELKAMEVPAIQKCGHDAKDYEFTAVNMVPVFRCLKCGCEAFYLTK